MILNRKNYYEKNKDEITEKNKEYRYEHKLEKAEIDRKYYEQNKEKISAKQKEIVICECGCKINKSSWYKHIKTINPKKGQEMRRV